MYLCGLALLLYVLLYLLVIVFLFPNDGVRAIYGSRRSPKYRQSIRQPVLVLGGHELPSCLVDFYLSNQFADQENLTASGIGPQRYIVEFFLPLDQRLERVRTAWDIPVLPFAVTPSRDFYVLNLELDNHSVWVHTLSGQRYLISPSIDDFLTSISGS
jgi:hypothetical protein